MDVTTQRRCLGVLAAGLFAGTAGVIVWSVAEIKGNEDLISEQGPTTPAIEEPARQFDSAFVETFAAKRLRQPLFDPPPKPIKPPAEPKQEVVQATPSPPPPAKLEVTLVGTIIQPDQSLAIVADATGGFDVKGIGESLELSPQGITVERIESERVTLRYQGRQSTIELDRSKATDDGSAGNRGVGRRRNNR